jgi:predicted AlkP superfamily pyrophosphatase or phosphodiesterase
MVIPARQRIDGVLDWLRRPAASRPRLVTLYFDTVDTAGHTFGPDAVETTAAAGDVDAAIGALLAGLRQLDQPANLVVVADHGMAATSRARTIAIDQIASPDDYRLFDTGPFASLYPVAGHEAALEKALLRPHDHLQCWRKADIPARFHYGTNPRIPPYFCLAETGWLIAKTAPTRDGDKGNHGYDNMAPEMAALFVAAGPNITQAGRLPDFDNVDVAPLLRDLLGLPPGDRLDGDDSPFKGALH